jgi:hypothetical protein
MPCFICNENGAKMCGQGNCGVCESQNVMCAADVQLQKEKERGGDTQPGSSEG